MLNVMTANVWVKMHWNDDKLKWNPSDYNGLKSVHLGAHEIWLPDIYLMNSATHGVEYYGDRHCIVSADGMVLWVPPTIFHTPCPLDFTYWPFESNTCKLSLISWTYDGTEIDLKILNSGVDLESYQPISDWIVKNVTASRKVDFYDCCPNEPYLTLDYDFQLARSSDLYYHIVFIPTIPIILLALSTFWLQPQSEIRLIINASVFLIILLYLIYFGNKIPARYDSLPLIIRFYSGSLYQTSISLIISTFVINISKMASCATVPRPVRRFLLRKGGKFLGLGEMVHEIESHRSIVEQEMCESHLMDITSPTAPFANLDNINQQSISSSIILPSNSVNKISKMEWILLGVAIDRLVFLIFLIVYLAMVFLYLPTKKFNYPKDNIPYWHH